MSVRIHTPVLLAVLGVVLGSCNYEPPLRDKGDRFRVDTILNTITGSIRLYGPSEPANAMVLVFDADSPGPPEGTSGPVDFAIVRVDEFTGSADFGFTANWAATEVPDGEYVVDVIVDYDGDFSPGAFTLGGATCGDWQGSHFGISVPAQPGTTTGNGTGPVYGKGRVRVEGGEVATGVDVTVEQELVNERPAFRFASDDGYATISIAATAAAIPPQYEILSTGIHAQFPEAASDQLHLDDPCTVGADQRVCVPDTGCEGAISLYYPDKDGDGQMDPHPDYPPDFGLKDVWPRVFLEYLGTVEMENGKVVRDENGYPVITPPELDEGVFWGGENFVHGIEAAGFGLALAPIGVPTKVQKINAMFPNLVAQFFPDGHPECGGAPGGCTKLFDSTIPEQAAQIPRGAWGVNLISWNGQTWGLPNELSEWGIQPTEGSSFDPKLQGGFLLVVD